MLTIVFKMLHPNSEHKVQQDVARAGFHVPITFFQSGFRLHLFFPNPGITAHKLAIVDLVQTLSLSGAASRNIRAKNARRQQRRSE